MWWRNYDNVLSRFRRIPECDGQTDRQTIHPWCIVILLHWQRRVVAAVRLLLNAAKTEFLWSSSGQFALGLILSVLHRRSATWGSTWTLNISMTTHVSKTVSSCLAALRQIRSVKRSVTRPVLLSLVQSLVLTMAMQHWLVWVDGWWHDFSLFCTPLLGWSTPNGSTST